ncbi:MAG: Eco57I restriction-modification methylase domain-containing protein [Spirochaetaceae bacterium]|jgi:hypothetical protein|nr:Eco57I restriction-modification methylase domain-containing protein [Spirochaetaceae bacterium]
MIDFNKSYNRQDWLSFLADSLLPDDFDEQVKQINYSSALKHTKQVYLLGECPSLGLSVMEIKHSSYNDARVGLTKEAARLICDYTGYNRALVLFVPEVSTGSTSVGSHYRFSFVEFTPIVDTQSGKTHREFSNPRRYSFVLGQGAKTKTPEQYLAKRITDYNDLKNRFSVEVLTKEFYTDLFTWYDKWAIKLVKFPKGFGSKVDLVQGDENRIHLIRLITRLIFVWFIKQKGLVPEWIFEKEELGRVLAKFNSASTADGNYYNAILQNLFFATLNKPVEEREFANEGNAAARKEDYGIKTKYRDNVNVKSYFAISHHEFIKKLETVPFLNGGLFECLDHLEDKQEYIDGFSREKTRQAFVPNALFFGDGSSDDAEGKEHFGLLELFNLYNFTVEENTPQDVEVALDPELLGKAFENLLASYNPETNESARKATGSFYTPREIVNYMVDASLKEYLKEKLTANHANHANNTVVEPVETTAKLDILFSYDTEGNPFNPDETKTLIDAINRAKILDPACGSGAFPMGVLQRLVFLLQKLDPDNKEWQEAQRQRAITETEEAYKIGNKAERDARLLEISEIFEKSKNKDDYSRKLFLIENCIYGIDIQPIAIQISKLRFFISLIVEQKANTDKTQNYGIRPLPNLETKFVAANTLIGVHRNKDILPDQEVDKVQGELLKIRHEHFNAKTSKQKRELRDRDREKTNELIKLLEEEHFYPPTDAIQMAAWNPYDQNGTAPIFDAEWMFGVKDGFDVVIGNPPYVFARNSEIKGLTQKAKADYYTNYKLAEYQINLYPLFIEKGTNLLNTSGVLCFITPNNWLTLNTNKLLRQFVLAQSEISILNFYKRVFESADVDAAVIIFKKDVVSNDRENIDLLEWTDNLHYLGVLPKSIFKSQKDCVINIDLVKNAELITIMNSIEHNTIPLSQIAIVKAGLKAYERGKGTPAQTEKMVTNRVYHSTTAQKGFTKYLNGKDVCRYTLKWSGEYLKYGNNLAAPRGSFDLFSTPRILVRQIPSPLPYCINACYTDEILLNDLNSMNIINITLPYQLVLGCLNSKLLSFWFANKFGKLQRGLFPQFKINELQQFPIPIICDNSRSFVDKTIALVDKILAAKKTNPAADTKEQEDKIDALVYELYGLTEEEIAVVEGKK